MTRAARIPLATAALLAACVAPHGIDYGKAKETITCATEAPIRRLTRFEYDNTVRDLLGDDSHPAQAFVPDELAHGFDNQAETLVVTQLLAEQYLGAAEQIAARAMAQPAKLLPCDPAVIGDDACAHAFIDDFGKRAFRRPIDDAQRERMFGVYASGRHRYGFGKAIELVIQTALMSPRFLYRVELGAPDPAASDVLKLDPYEIASRLSYLLWASMPDAELLAAADRGELSTTAEIAAQATRMLADPRARAAVSRFHEEWLGLSKLDELAKDSSVYPAYQSSLPPLWKKETLTFLERVVFDEHGDVATMLTAPWSMQNADLAAFYGNPGSPAGDDFERVDLDPSERAGFLTHASILAAYAKANQSSPVHRGKLVREALLCQTLPAPPSGMPLQPPPVDPHATTRQKYLEHSANPTCAECHDLMDGIGFGFEHYDGIGQWRDLDHGFPVDATGTVVDTKDANGDFDGVVALANRLSGSQEVRDCLVTQWFRYGYGRVETQADACAMTSIRDAFEASGRRVEALLLALVQTEAFRYKRVPAP